ncbi:hypothetical protein CW751_14535 [Brumimicrobium salinarum]|uniref:DUF4249 domain-containing protein n=1 Tax=Brumimicrobium salinarum TaxID=2058658 RepID=A0A2I0QZ04_9FLAO|nr:DUF4249 family protein [Brumimicrobium salinarum]PKR79564.1 hypothetical protein CW751_14535 [Brumimicrobium salinarum]
MKESNYFIILLYLALLSCSKEIEIDLEKVEPRLVVRSEITNKPDTVAPGPGTIFPQYIPAKLELGLSSSVTDDPTENIVDAKVVLKKNNFVYDTIYYNSTKEYYELFETPDDLPEPGDDLSLEVIYNNEKVSSSAKMPSKVDIISIDTSIYYSHYIEGTGMFSEGTLTFQDPGSEENYYELMVCSSGLYNGELNPLRIKTDETFITGEKHYPSEINTNQYVFDQKSLLFTDKTFNGEKKSVRFYFIIGGYKHSNTIDFGHKTRIYLLRNVTKEYYMFKTSKRTYLLNSGENFLMGASEPQNVYTNIKDGLGSFGVYTHDQEIYFFPKRTIQL